LAIGQKEAQTANLNAQPELKEQAAELNQAKLDEKTRHDTQTADAALRREGYKLGPDGKPVPLTPEEMSSKEQAADDLANSRQEYEAALADYRKAQTANLPEQMELARTRALTAIQNAHTAAGRLGISAQALAFHEDEFYNPQPTGTERSHGD